MLARIAADSSPVRSTTFSPVPMSVVTTENGSGRLSMLRSPRSAPTSVLKNSLIFCPPTTPWALSSPRGVKPSSSPG
jgi:hypothetical protein